MSIIRIKHSKAYTCINNATLRDHRLSFKARGILVYLLSHPDNWNVNTKHLASSSDRDGATSIASGLKELKSLGYFRKVAIRDEGGKISHWETHLHEIPEEGYSSEGKNQIMENPQSGLTTNGKPAPLISNEYKQVLNSTSTECKKGRTRTENAAPVDPDPIHPEPAPTSTDRTTDHIPAPSKKEIDPEDTQAPRRVEVVVNKYDDAIINGHRRRQEQRDRHAQQHSIQGGAFASVDDEDAFWKAATWQLMQESKGSRAEKTHGQAQGLASWFVRQLNAGETTDPQAREYFRMWQDGTLGTQTDKPNTISDAQFDAIAAQLSQKYA